MISLRHTLFAALFTAFLILASNHFPVTAQEDTTATAESNVEQTETSEDESNLDNTLNSLREKIETQVDQINSENKNIVKGTIETIDEDEMILDTASDDAFTVSLDGTVTTYYAVSINGAEEIELTDLNEGDTVVISGPIIEDQASANIVMQQTEYMVLQGQITATDDTNSAIDVVTQQKDEYTLDIDDDTTQFMMNTVNLNLDRSGFSRFKVGDSIHFVAQTPDDEDTSRLTAIRTLIVPQEFFVEDSPDESDTDEEATDSAQ